MGNGDTPFRLDKALVMRGIVPSRSRGVVLIGEGKVSVNNKIVTNRSHIISEEDVIQLLSDDIPWVSRSGAKLAFALIHWGVSLKGKVVLDIGASTGGFTHVALEGGAILVYALDVGHHQLSEILKNDSRVKELSGVHINNVSLSQFVPPPDLIVIDVSFISLTNILLKVKELSGGDGEIIALLKPQFEVGREYIRKGIVRNPTLHEQAIVKVKESAKALGFEISEVIDSPILGGDGNKEFLIHLTQKKEPLV